LRCNYKKGAAQTPGTGWYQVRLFQNFSFGTATLDLREKAGFRPLFPRACGKTIGFFHRLRLLKPLWSGHKPRIHPRAFENISGLSATWFSTSALKVIINPSLFHNTVGYMADPYLPVHRKIFTGDGAMPYIVIAFSMPHKMTAMVP
jgi:hypothetical protein